MAKRHFLQLAHNYDPKKHQLANRYLSEKLDGMRAFWDGGVSKGMLASDVPYANTAKDDRYQTPPVATGLWSRYGKVINCPDWWSMHLPPYPLDGELYLGRNSFQTLRSIVSTLIPGPGWAQVKYYVFDKPHPTEVFAPGNINETNFTKEFDGNVLNWWLQRNKTELKTPVDFAYRYTDLKQDVYDHPVIIVHKQIILPYREEEAQTIVTDELFRITTLGGEGVMVRAGYCPWVPERSYNILKIKKLLDAEATVVGYTTGRETDKGSKHLGRMGALIVSFQGKQFELSGFTDEERRLIDSNGNIETAHEWARQNPEKVCPSWIENPSFKRGSIVSFKFRELTDDGIPKEARYFRRIV